jgi:hypothetical protein
MRIKWFVFGVLTTVIALSASAYVYLEKGFVDARADIKPGALDSWLGSAMDLSTGRHAPEGSHPSPRHCRQFTRCGDRIHLQMLDLSRQHQILFQQAVCPGAQSELSDAVLPPPEP